MSGGGSRAGGRVGWSLVDMPDLSGTRAMVTGVTSGIGEQTALELARHGAEVILAARSEGKLDITEAHLREALPQGTFHRVRIDLSDLSSVRRAAAEAAALGPLNLLINNAGVMAVPYERTIDGFELQFATNHLGPFLLTGLLLPRLIESGDGRVVAVSSQAHRLTRTPPLEDPRQQNGRYSRWGAYARSKLADLLFVYELDRRCREARLPVKALAAHPGYASTGLMAQRSTGNRRSQILQAAFSLAGQPAQLGALPTLMAATADLPGSTYIGPGNFLQMRGMPRIVTSRPLARKPEAQRALWALSEEATGIRYP